MYKPQPWREGEIVCIDTSVCENYRYSLEVRWGKPGNRVVVIGLNPSTADMTRDDKTIRQCIDWARGEGCVGLLMVNAYSFRAKLPSHMKAASDPFGGQTPENLVEMCGRNRVVVAWGNHANYRRRGDEIAVAFAKAGMQLECWGLNVSGSPKHPGRIGIGKTEPWPAGSKTTSS
jgi:hypothetical protein